jgi:streptogramin lyase
MLHRKSQTIIVAASVSILLAACGGGSGSGAGGATGLSSATDIGSSSNSSGGLPNSSGVTTGSSVTVNSGGSGSSGTGSSGPGTVSGSHPGSSSCGCMSNGGSSTSFIYDATARFNEPSDIVTDKSGNVFVLDKGNKTVRRIAPDGNVTTVSRAFINPVAIALDTNGNVYVDDSGTTIYKLLPDGEQSVSFPYTDFPYFAVDSKGNIFIIVSATNGISTVINRISPNGDTTAFFSEPGVTYHGLAIDQNDNLYTVGQNLASRALEKISPQGTSTVVATNVYSTDYTLGNLAVDSVGNVYLSYYIVNLPAAGSGQACAADPTAYFCNIYESSQTIEKITPAGATSTIVTGPPGSAGQANPNEYDSHFGASYVAVGTGDNLYVSYSDNQTVYKISQSGAASLYAGTAGQAGNSD